MDCIARALMNADAATFAVVIIDLIAAVLLSDSVIGTESHAVVATIADSAGEAAFRLPQNISFCHSDVDFGK